MEKEDGMRTIKVGLRATYLSHEMAAKRMARFQPIGVSRKAVF
jgi:hypothetical protein